jgi:hypothetical protein
MNVFKNHLHQYFPRQNAGGRLQGSIEAINLPPPAGQMLAIIGQLYKISGEHHP